MDIEITVVVWRVPADYISYHFRKGHVGCKHLYLEISIWKLNDGLLWEETRIGYKHQVSEEILTTFELWAVYILIH